MKFTTAVVGALAAASCANAFVAPGGSIARGIAAKSSSVQPLYAGGKYDGKLWDDAAKADVLSTYDPSAPRSETNFDPNVKDAAGNKCDASGYYPGEGKYKDPIRPDVSFAEYMKQKAEKEAGGQ